MDNSQPTSVGSILIDLKALSDAARSDGLQWGCASDDLNLTLLSWGEQGHVAPHVNNEVDVVLIGVEGTGQVLVDDTPNSLQPGQALLIPKGARRSIQSTSQHFSYLSVHRRRPGLMPTLGGKPIS